MDLKIIGTADAFLSLAFECCDLLSRDADAHNSKTFGYDLRNAIKGAYVAATRSRRRGTRQG